MGRSIKDEEFTNIIKLKNEEFEDSIKKKFNEFRNKRIKAITEATNLELEKRVFLQTIDFLWRSHLQYLRTFKTSSWVCEVMLKKIHYKNSKEKHLNYLKNLNKIKIDFITFLK